MENNNWDPFDEDEFAEAMHRRTEELYSVQDLLPNDQGLINGPVLAMRDMVIYPHMVSPLFVGRDPTLWAIENAQSKNLTLIALTQRDPSVDNPGPDDFFPIGVEMAVGRLLNMPDGSYSALVQARRRVELIEFTQTEPFLRVSVRPVYESVRVDREIEATMRTAVELFNRCIQLNRSLPEEAHLFALNIEEPGWLADMIATSISPGLKERLQLLAMVDPRQRLDRVVALLAQELDVLELEDEIQSRTQSEVDRTQREFYLREQMKVIQTELGEGDPWLLEINELRTRIESVGLPEEAELRALKEVNRLTQMPPVSPEVGIIRTYIDWILELPWEKLTDDNLDVTNAAEILEKYHYGLPKAKERILEYIAVKKLHPKKTRQPILCFVGPPGTGKTSLGRSIAEALGRKFVRLSLGGVRDEAEIRGHRRTYIGALPGRIIQTMRKAESSNPLFMLDEIDKLGVDFRGDPSSALLEVLDPEQNNSFSDHYLELAFDLSKVMFITTANSEYTIPPALLDRMEVIEFPGYIEEEKLEIARRFLIPRQVEENGLEDEEIRFSEQAVQRIIREFTYEAGVRNLEREIGRISRKIARLKAEEKSFPTQIASTSIEKFLGPPQFFSLEAEREDEVGVATALAWTSNGGEIMPVEVLLIDGKGNLQLTGQLGEVMQESVQAALSYLKSRAAELKIDLESIENIDIHLHIPEGAIPKDGPSAGITVATALMSALTERKVRCDTGMTGEITLRGRVLPVGGVREKVLAAHRAGIKNVVLPKKNLKDLVDVPKKARNDLNICPVEHLDEVLDIAVLPPDKPKASSASGTRKKARTKKADPTPPPEDIDL
jgi:ATP-dependent Lon protease